MFTACSSSLSPVKGTKPFYAENSSRVPYVKSSLIMFLFASSFILFIFHILSFLFLFNSCMSFPTILFSFRAWGMHSFLFAHYRNTHAVTPPLNRDNNL